MQSIFLNSLPNLDVFLYNIWYSHCLKAGSQQCTSFTTGIEAGDPSAQIY